MSDRLDIRVGDLIKATSKENPEETTTGRVRHVGEDYLATSMRNLLFKYYDFEVLDRPLPPISEELLRGAVAAYFRGESYPHLNLDSLLAKDIKSVINFVREYDQKNATKENA